MLIKCLTYHTLCYKISVGLFSGARHRLLSLEHDKKTCTSVIPATTTSTVISTAITSPSQFATAIFIPLPSPAKTSDKVHFF